MIILSAICKLIVQPPPPFFLSSIPACILVPTEPGEAWVDSLVTKVGDGVQKALTEGVSLLDTIDQNTLFLDDNAGGAAAKDFALGTFDTLKGAFSFYKNGILHCESGKEEAECRAAGGCLQAPYNKTQNMIDNGDLLENGCPPYIYITESFFSNHCLPNLPGESDYLTDEGKELIGAFNNGSLSMKTVQTIFKDVSLLKTEISVLLGGTVVLSFLLVITASCWGKWIIWGMIGLMFLAFFGGIGFLGYRFYGDWTDYYGMPELDRNPDVWRDLQMSGGLFLVCFLVGSLFLCVVCSMRKRIKSGLKFLSMASEASCEACPIFFVPLLCSLMMAAWFAVVAVIGIYVATASGEEKPETGYFIFFGDKFDKQAFFFLFALLALYWGCNLWGALEKFIIATTISQWYIADGNHKGWHIWMGFKNGLWYNFGSIAFGSFIIAIIQIVQIILGFILERFESADGGDNCGVCCFAKKACCCCLWCAENVMKWASTNSYIEIAIWGDGFCEASCRALTVLLNSLELVVVFNGIAYLIALVAKVIVCCCIGIASYYYFEYVQGGKQDDELGSAEFATMYSAVTFLCMCLGYLIADAFTDTYEMTGDTVLICFLEDIKHNYQQGRKMTGPDQVLKGVLNAHVKKAEIHTSNA